MMTTKAAKCMVLLMIITLSRVGSIRAEQKPLYSINLKNLQHLEPQKNVQLNSDREETGVLHDSDTENAELVVKGETYVRYLVPGSDSTRKYNLNTVYVADRNGYRANFTLRIMELNVKRIGILALKSAAG